MYVTESVICICCRVNVTSLYDYVFTCSLIAYLLLVMLPPSLTFMERRNTRKLSFFALEYIIGYLKMH